MLRALSAGVSGLQQFQQKLDVIGNNIANSNTLGFKMARADFEDNFSQSMSSGGNAIQVGSGVSTAAVRSLYRTGNLESTQVDTYMAIDGDGFFTVADPVSGNEYLTRAGDFDMDKEGYLITNSGYRVQGFSDAGLTQRGALRIDDTGKPAGNTGAYKSFSVDDRGVIKVNLDNGTSFTRGQVLLQRFMDPNALTKEGGNLLSATEAAGAIGGPQAPSTNGLGKIAPMKLEASNVDLAVEFATLISTQRGFQASARIVTTSDEILQEVVNLKR